MGVSMGEQRCLRLDSIRGHALPLHTDLTVQRGGFSGL